MATINYAEEKLSRGEKIIKWLDVASGDEGELYDLTGHEVMSVYVHESSAGDVNVQLLGANADVGLANFISLNGFNANNLVSGLANLSGILRPRFIAPKAVSGSTGTLSFYVLLKEI